MAAKKIKPWKPIIKVLRDIIKNPPYTYVGPGSRETEGGDNREANTVLLGYAVKVATTAILNLETPEKSLPDLITDLYELTLKIEAAGAAEDYFLSADWDRIMLDGPHPTPILKKTVAKLKKRQG